MRLSSHGHRCLAGNDAGGLKLWSRRGNLLTSQFPKITAGFKSLPSGSRNLDNEQARCRFRSTPIDYGMSGFQRQFVRSASPVARLSKTIENCQIKERRLNMKTNPVVWFEIYVQDMNRAKEFYEAMLGVHLGKLESPVPEVELWSFPMQENGAGATGALVKMERCPPGGNSTLVYFACSDCAVEAKRAASNGGQIFKDKFSIGPHGFIALVIDPEGNMIGLHSMQ
jgi:uncharacterized protein